MSTKKKPAQKPSIPKPTLKETSMELVKKLTNAVICGDGTAVKAVLERLDGFLKNVQEQRDKVQDAILAAKSEIDRINAETLKNCGKIHELDCLKENTNAALRSIANLGEIYRTGENLHV